MSTIKSFLYLDEYKMYSFSSQIFEGLTEYVIDYKKTRSEDIEEQKGPIGSGRILANIITEQAGTQEKKFLHDYSYTLFENRLIEDKRVLSLDKNNVDAAIEDIKAYSFVKVSGKATFNDIPLIRSTIESFNEIGEAFAYVSKFDDLKQQSEVLSQRLGKVTDRNKKASLKAKAKSQMNIKKVAKEAGLNMDDDYLKYLSFILNYGYKDHFEIQIPLDGDIQRVFFTAVLKRESLKENEQILIKKHARNSEKEFSLFGVVTQCERDIQLIRDESNQKGSSPENMKAAMLDVVSKFTRVEDTFIGRLTNEIIIDPIAIYLEL